MEVSDLINEQIVHKVYGKGIIKLIEGEYLNASFDSGIESRFSFPSCLDKFVRLTDEDKQNELQQFLNKWKDENGIFERERIHKLTAETQAGIKRRAEEREIRRIQREKEVASRNRMFRRVNKQEVCQ